MRWPLMTLLLATACAEASTLFGRPLSVPVTSAGPAVGTDAHNKRHGQVEVIVKSSFEAIKDDIRDGGGPALTKAMNAAGIPARDRPTRVIQLQSDADLYNAAPGALVTALMLYSS